MVGYVGQVFFWIAGRKKRDKEGMAEGRINRGQEGKLLLSFA